MLTPQQSRALDFIAAYQAQNRGVSPGYRKIASHLGLRSSSGAQRVVGGLIERGFVKRRDRQAHSLEILRRPNERPQLALKYATDDEVLGEVARRWGIDLVALLQRRIAAVQGAELRRAA